MNNLCTVSDSNYLEKGLCLYSSLQERSSCFILHYLCLDEACYEKIKPLENASLKVYSVSGFLQSDDRLLSLLRHDYKQFAFCMASYFSNNLLSQTDSITYIDSDIFFHEDIDCIFKEIGDRDVGIFRHRQIPLSFWDPNGLFNVGVVFFRNTDLGRHISSWWVEAVLSKTPPEYSTCGDQKYLDLFPSLCPSSKLYIDENIGHGAPWLWHLYEFTGGHRIIWNGEEQNLVFTHFSQFLDKGDSYIPSTMHHINSPLSLYKDNKYLKEIYDEYHCELQKVKAKHNEF